jgi:phospholipid/cholesterol/gamma-HCH transport system substrate-binding protein
MSTAAKVGAFFLVVLIITCLLIWKIEALRFGHGAARHITVEFADVTGLDEKSLVRLAGVPVGRVSKIHLDKGGKAVVEIELDGDVDLRQGASGSIASRGLLGDKYVELVPGPVGAPALPDGTRLVGDVPVTFDQITKLARDIGTELHDISQNLNKSLGGAAGEERLTNIVENVRVISEELKLLVLNNRANVNESIANLREFSTMVTKLTDRIDRLVAANEPNVTAGIGNIKEVSAKLETTADNLNQITGKMREGEGTFGKLIQSEETHKNLNDALKEVKDGIANLTSTLSKANKIGLDFDLHSEYLSRQGKGQGAFSVDVIPESDKPRYYRLGINTLPNGLRTKDTSVITTTFPDGHTEVKTIQTVDFQDKYAFTALVGWRFRDFTGRAGVIESRAGVGLDYELLKRRLRLSAEVFDFSRDNLSPHARVLGRYFFGPSVYLTAGWDDLLNRNRKQDSMLLGAGVRWGDDDLKYLIGFLAARP